MTAGSSSGVSVSDLVVSPADRVLSGSSHDPIDGSHQRGLSEPVVLPKATSLLLRSPPTHAAALPGSSSSLSPSPSSGPSTAAAPSTPPPLVSARPIMVELKSAGDGSGSTATDVPRPPSHSPAPAAVALPPVALSTEPVERLARSPPPLTGTGSMDPGSARPEQVAAVPASSSARPVSRPADPGSSSPGMSHELDRPAAHSRAVQEEDTPVASLLLARRTGPPVLPSLTIVTPASSSSPRPISSPTSSPDSASLASPPHQEAHPFDVSTSKLVMDSTLTPSSVCFSLDDGLMDRVGEGRTGPSPSLHRERSVSVSSLTGNDPGTSLASSSIWVSLVCPPSGPRRASVDTGGVALGFERGLDADAVHHHGLVDFTTDEELEERTDFAEILSDLHVASSILIDAALPVMSGSFAPITQEHRARLAQSMATWSFEPQKLSEDDLFHCSCILFDAVLSIDGLSQLGLPRERLHSLLLSIRAIYLPASSSAYHNFAHGVDVLQSTYYFLQEIGLAPPFSWILSSSSDRSALPWRRGSSASGRAAEVIRPQDVLALLLAAIGHDVAHPGLSNALMNNAKTPIARVFADKGGSLENMHCLLLTSLLRKHGFGFLLNTPSLSPTAPAASTLDGPSTYAAVDWTGFRSLLSATIMSTDMAQHFSWISKLTELGDRVQDGAAGVSGDLEAVRARDRVLICSTILKASDISNPARPFEVSQYWSDQLLLEWHLQANLEIGLSLPVSVVQSANPALQARGQKAFIELFCEPLYSAAARVMPQLAPLADRLASNRALWSDRLAALLAASPIIGVIDNDTSKRSSSSISIVSSPSSAPSHLSTSNRPFSPSDDLRYRTLFSPTVPPSLFLCHDRTTSEPGSPGTSASEERKPLSPSSSSETRRLMQYALRTGVISRKRTHSETTRGMLSAGSGRGRSKEQL